VVQFDSKLNKSFATKQNSSAELSAKYRIGFQARSLPTLSALPRKHLALKPTNTYTYVAAGLPFDAPMHDLSALCMESHIGSEDRWAARRVVEIP
jgi:hypothetical protein